MLFATFFQYYAKSKSISNRICHAVHPRIYESSVVPQYPWKKYSMGIFAGVLANSSKWPQKLKIFSNAG